MKLRNGTMKVICAGMTTAMLMTGMSAMVFADEPNAKDIGPQEMISYTVAINADKLDPANGTELSVTDPAGASMYKIKLDGKTGKVMISEDDGKTWKETEDVITVNGKSVNGNADADLDKDVEKSTISVKFDPETGKASFSEDGGKTWKDAEECGFDLKTLSKEDLEKFMNGSDDGMNTEGTAFKSASFTAAAKAIDTSGNKDNADIF